MDLMEVYAPVARFFARICEVEIPIAGYDIPVGAFFVFAGLISLIVAFLHSLSD